MSYLKMGSGIPGKGNRECQEWLLKERLLYNRMICLWGGRGSEAAEIDLRWVMFKMCK